MIVSTSSLSMLLSKRNYTMKNTRLQASFDKAININLNNASIYNVYFAAKRMENENKFLPRYFNSYNMNSNENFPELIYDMNELIFKVKGPTNFCKTFRLLFNRMLSGIP